MKGNIFIGKAVIKSKLFSVREKWDIIDKVKSRVLKAQLR